jgi:alpha,alpha-trehalase
VEGLLASGMIQTARGIIENFADIIKLAGFVPNGSRVYYMNRSQPPLLTQMVYSYYKLTGDSGLVEETLDQLDKEYEFWMARKCVRVVIDGERYKLNMYNVNGSHPRPESYREDFDNANQSNNREMYFSNIMSATESGWDFSSRWFSDPMDIKTIQITNIIPIDLNAIMYCNEVILAEFHRLLGTRKAKSYEQAASKRQKVINTLLWDKKVLSWGDYNILTKKVNSSYLYISDLSPLWSGIEPPVDANIILTRYQSLLMDHVSGIPASNIKSGQQWDFPNVWAPYHFWAVDYFRKINRFDIALNIAQRFVNTVYQGWHKTNYIFEKYEADTAGAYGGGGE